MKIKLKIMKNKIILICIYFSVWSHLLLAQNINYGKSYSSGMVDFYVDSPEKEVSESNKFPNHPYTVYNYIPTAKSIAIVFSILKTDTISLYRFSILEDGTPLEVNKAFNKIVLKERKFDEKFNILNLGTYNIANKNLTVLSYKITDPDKIYKSIFYAKPIRPVKIEYFSKDITYADGNIGSSIDRENNSNIKLSANDNAINVIINKTDFTWYYVTIKEKATNQIVFKSSSWEYSAAYYNQEQDDYLPFMNVDKSFFKKSGDYEISIEPFIWNISPKKIAKYTTKHTLSITLEDESYSKKELIIYCLIICAVFGAIGGAALTYIKKKEAKKIAQQYKEKEIAKLQLNSIRSQLNPHFLFNALSGIQNLMNKNEIDNANKYLSKFARLTRNVLDDKELINLGQEKTLLDDYLRMEQLRFGFQYEINADKNLDLENIEIPSMLLQPFVENAVKHGIASKNAEGKIEITFGRNINNLVLTLADNGKGFNADKRHEGLGLSLSKNRISLLNSIYKETPFVLSINSSNAGTKITLTLTDWL